MGVGHRAKQARDGERIAADRLQHRAAHDARNDHERESDGSVACSLQCQRYERWIAVRGDEALDHVFAHQRRPAAHCGKNAHHQRYGPGIGRGASEAERVDEARRTAPERTRWLRISESRRAEPLPQIVKQRARHLGGVRSVDRHRHVRESRRRPVAPSGAAKCTFRSPLPLGGLHRERGCRIQPNAGAHRQRASSGRTGLSKPLTSARPRSEHRGTAT
jgi:hypothetical protein